MDQVAVLNHQMEGDLNYRKEQCRQDNGYNGLTPNDQHRQGEFYSPMDPWYWQINHDISRHEINKKPTAFLFDPFKQENCQRNQRKAALDHGNRQSWATINFQTLTNL